MTQGHARLAVVGLGRIGRLHAANLAGRVPSAELVGVVDPVEPLAGRLGGVHGVPWSTSLDRMLEDVAIDGVVIAAPSRMHCALVELAARAGKHVLCEKPLGLALEDARQAVAAAEAAGVALQVGFQRRFDPDWLALHGSIVSDELGQLHLLRSSHRNARPPAAPDSLGDLFVDVAVHDLDAARWLAGEVAEVFAMTRAAPAMSATIALRLESGALGLVDVARDAGYGFECSAEAVGSHGTARIGSRHRHGGVELMRDGVASAPLPADHAERHGAAYVAELEHFAAVVAGGASARPAGDDAVAALELALMAARSAELGVPLATAEATR